MRIEGAIFDLDGTLLDSMPVWDDIGEKYLRSLGLTPARDLQGDIKVLSLAESARLLRREYQLPYTEEEIMAGINGLIEDQYRAFIQLKPGARKLLRSLHDAGVKMCIATATDRYLVETALERLDLSAFFQFIITCGEVGCGKDQQVIYNTALGLLATKRKNTVVFEDALHAIKTAKNAGFTVVGVYDPSAAEDQELIRSIADFYIYSLREWEALQL